MITDEGNSSRALVVVVLAEDIAGGGIVCAAAVAVETLQVEDLLPLDLHFAGLLGELRELPRSAVKQVVVKRMAVLLLGEIENAHEVWVLEEEEILIGALVWKMGLRTLRANGPATCPTCFPPGMI